MTSVFERIAEDHPIWSAQWWGPYDEAIELCALPGPLIRWWLCDYALFRMGEAIVTIPPTQPAVTKTWHPTFATIYANQQYCLHPTPGQLQRMLRAAKELWVTSRHKYLWNIMGIAHMASYSTVSRKHILLSMGMKRPYHAIMRSSSGRAIVLLQRLKYLCLVWNTCGERALWLLYEDKCPILWDGPHWDGYVKHWGGCINETED